MYGAKKDRTSEQGELSPAAAQGEMDPRKTRKHFVS